MIHLNKKENLPPTQLYELFPVMTEAEVKHYLDLSNPANPFADYVGNSPAVDQAIELAAQAFSEESTIKMGCWSENGVDVKVEGAIILARDEKKRKVQHASIREVSECVLVVGRKSSGKTKFAHCLGKLIGTVFAEIDGTSFKKTEQIFEAIRSALMERNVRLVPRKVGTKNHYEIPPMTLFIDEVHALPKALQDCLLKMMEANDRTLHLPNVVLDVGRILMIFATTDLGKLKGTFKDRCIIIKLLAHSVQQVAQIVQNNNPDWKMPLCQRVAKIQPVPRQALRFAENAIRTADFQHCSIEQAVNLVAERWGISEEGLSITALKGLEALAQAADAGLSKKSICVSLSIEEEEWENDVLPLLLYNDSHPAYIRITNKHYITEAGLEVVRQHGGEVE